MKAIEVNNVSKMYRLGEISTGSIAHDLNRWMHKVRGKEDPYSKIAQTNKRDEKTNSEYVWSLKDINFSVEQGDILGIIGKNGAGKSTLLKILSRVTGPTTGSVKMRGRVASLLEVGTGFHPDLTGRENVYLNGAILGMRKWEIKSKFDEIVAFSGVDRYIDTPVKRYSSGMYVRLAFAVAAHLEPEILIVDEVLAVGDAEFQKKCIGKMSDISKGEGRTILFVSHNLGSVKNLCTSGLMLEDGTVKTMGNIDDVIFAYTEQNQIEMSIEKTFQNTQNLPVFIEKVELLVNGEKAKVSNVDFKDRLGFNIYLDVNQDVKNRGLVITCFNKNEKLLMAYDISVHPELFSKREIGKYLVIAEFPCSFFIEGEYSFDFHIGHFGNAAEQYEKGVIGVKVEIMSRNPRFEPAVAFRKSIVHIDPIWEYIKLS